MIDLSFFLCLCFSYLKMLAFRRHFFEKNQNESDELLKNQRLFSFFISEKI